MMCALARFVLVIGTTDTTVGYSWSVSPLSRIVKVFDEDTTTPNVPPAGPNSKASGGTPTRSSNGADVLGQPAFEPVILNELPGDFRLTDQIADEDNQLELLYVNNDGRRIDLVNHRLERSLPPFQAIATSYTS